MGRRLFVRDTLLLPIASCPCQVMVR